MIYFSCGFQGNYREFSSKRKDNLNIFNAKMKISQFDMKYTDMEENREKG